MKFSGLFIGLTTIDIQFRVDSFPDSNQKVKTDAPEIFVGGPASNAAVAFSQLNGGAFLASAAGMNSFKQIIETDFKNTGIQHFDLIHSQQKNPVLAAVVTSVKNGDRTIFTHHPEEIVPDISAEKLVAQLNPQIILLDGFYPEFAMKCAYLARQNKIPVVLDGGSWKSQYNELLSITDTAICSADFLPPGCNGSDDVFEFLERKGIKDSAISRGGKSLLFRGHADGRGEVPVQKTEVKDTLGAGDFLHGAFCFYFLHNKYDFKKALMHAAKFATFTCKFEGTRSWIKNFQNENRFRNYS
jgi:sugar/nucleoside kinase (ribokinase family)